MKIILSSRRRHYVKRLSVFLITVALILGIAGCEGSCSCGATPLQYDLTASSTEGGDVIIPGEGTYADGTIVTLEAVADECYEFVEWTGADVADPYSPITTVTMDEAKSITAVFALLSYDLTVASTDGGAVSSPGEDTFTYDCGTEVALVAAAEEGYYFVNWSGDVDTIANINAPTTTITMMGDYSITANFELIPPGQFVLTTSSTAGGSVKTPGEGTFLYDEGTVVDLVAEAEECYEFVNWTGDNAADPNSATTTITMDGAKSVTANFALLSYNLTADSTGGGQVSSPGEGTFPYDCGTVVDLVAEADEGYQFLNWTGDVSTIANVNSASTNITMNGDYSITANFAVETMAMVVAAGYAHTVGLKDTSTAVAVGLNSCGQCDVDSWTNIVQVAAGGYHTLGLKNDNTVVAVGKNSSGQCDVDSWTNIVQVAAGVSSTLGVGGYHTLGLKNDNTVVAVGSNLTGQCNVGNWTDIIQVAAGSWHTVGLRSDGTVVAVGSSLVGQCNVGNWTDIIQVAAGSWHTVGLRSDGTVVAVGWNLAGQCNVGCWTDIVQVAAGSFHTVGVKNDGTVVAVGWNLFGQCNVGSWQL